MYEFCFSSVVALTRINFTKQKKKRLTVTLRCLCYFANFQLDNYFFVFAKTCKKSSNCCKYCKRKLRITYSSFTFFFLI